MSPPSDSRRVVLITGASSGIGRTCAQHLAARGWRVFGTQRQPPSASQASGPIEIVPMDVNQDASVQEAVQAVLSKAGRIDAVVNNAGIAILGAVEDTTLEDAKALFETNFFGVLRVCRAVLPIMRKQRSGHIVNIGSLAGIVGIPFSGMYSASKFAVEGMTEAMRLETKPFGIRVAIIEPGNFQSDLTERRRVVATAGTEGAYESLYRLVRGVQDHDEVVAGTPEPIARLLDRLLNDANPKLRHPIAKFMHSLMVPLRRLLPQRVFEWMLARLLGLGGAKV